MYMHPYFFIYLCINVYTVYIFIRIKNNTYIYILIAIKGWDLLHMTMVALLGHIS
jgi:hypothetical protein